MFVYLLIQGMKTIFLHLLIKCFWHKYTSYVADALTLLWEHILGFSITKNISIVHPYHRNGLSIRVGFWLQAYHGYKILTFNPTFYGAQTLG